LSRGKAQLRGVLAQGENSAQTKLVSFPVAKGGNKS
jgi:hypothetical protein